MVNTRPGCKCTDNNTRIFEKYTEKWSKDTEYRKRFTIN